jgi:hypothetical protein
VDVGKCNNLPIRKISHRNTCILGFAAMTKSDILSSEQCKSSNLTIASDFSLFFIRKGHSAAPFLKPNHYRALQVIHVLVTPRRQARGVFPCIGIQLKRNTSTKSRSLAGDTCISLGFRQDPKAFTIPNQHHFIFFQVRSTAVIFRGSSS